jgi:DNA-binding transcriptional ArsR family regulator
MKSCSYEYGRRSAVNREEIHRIHEIDEAKLSDLAELFKMFGDTTRVKILYDLFSGEKSVSEITEDLDMNQSAISHQLKILKTAKLIRSRREGKAMIYSLADDHVKTIILMGKEHIEE